MYEKTQKRVILYTRVSSDEQRERLSIEAQERSLRHYCENKGYEIVGEKQPYKEDYSAKHYDLKRPEIKSIYEYCKKNRGKVDMVLFLRWDRYSRNVEFAFTYKRKFVDEMGIEINAVEEPIDFSATDWSMWLAIRCGVAHTEDNKIARRTKEGIHEHLMRGEWCGIAPIGYKNVKTDKDAGIDHYLTIDPVKGPLVQQVFKEVAEGIESAAAIKRRLMPKATKSKFYKMLRNKFYTGIITVPKFQDYPETEVTGLHEPLIDMDTFIAVQQVMDGNIRRKPKVGKVNNPNLYLRKYIVCPICGHRLTGGTSKGNGGHYDYYYCNKDHKHIKIKAEKANNLFNKYISALKPKDAYVELYRQMLDNARSSKIKDNKEEAMKLREEIQKLNGRKNKVNDMFFDGDLSRIDRDEQIQRYNGSINELETRIKILEKSEELQIKDKLGYTINIIENLSDYFSTASAYTKTRILGSIFSQELEFDGEKYQTNSYNSVLRYIYENINMLEGQNKADSSENMEKSALVAPRGIEPRFKV